MSERDIVRVSAGSVQGVETEGVWSFRSIPYAAPAVGPLRFAAPAPVKPWDGVRSAATHGPSVPQRPMRGLVADMLPMNPHQEFDALHLNVWTPDPAGSGMPVLVWIHGGGFRSGSGNDELYDGSSFARDGIVTVSINYRLGAEGFLYIGDLAPDPGVTGAMGIADQVAALRWVRENISAFGGDPDHVTVAGESAGSMSVATLLAVPSAEGLFRRAICQSGGADKVNGTAESSRIGSRLLEKFGVRGENLTPLVEASAEDLLLVQDEMAAELASGTMAELYGLPATLATIAFLPTAGTELIPQEPLASLAAHGNGVDLLIGDNQDEASIFLAGVPDEIVARLGRTKLEAWLGADRADAVEALLADHMPEATERDRWVWLESERQFWSPVRRLAAANAAHGGRSFKYRFAWSSSRYPDLGAHHVIELPFVFDTLETDQGQAIAKGGPAGLARTVHAIWSDFIRGREPQLPDGEAWPLFTGTDRRRVVLTEDEVTIEPDVDLLGHDTRESSDG